jgi:hypothetical protein
VTIHPLELTGYPLELTVYPLELTVYPVELGTAHPLNRTNCKSAVLISNWTDSQMSPNWTVSTIIPISTGKLLGGLHAEDSAMMARVFPQPKSILNTQVSE